MSIQKSTNKRNSGFSLIEAMIAVLVLAVGLLALVALQSNLVREGADAKARSRIASLITSRMDEARAIGYTAIATELAAVCAANNDICQAQADAAVSGLSVTETVVLTPGVNGSEYKTLTVVAGWTDSAARARSLEMRTAISPLSLDTSSTLLNQQFAGDVSKSPVVRTANPATPGMIPIAVSATDSTAATNPRPELLGKGKDQSITGTKFDVLTYTNESASTARIQSRVETTVIKCECRYGAGGANLPEIFRQPQWPAVWTGERYDLFKPATAGLNAAGVGKNAGPSAAAQSALCTDCCRDHHDDSTAAVAKFDPERVRRTEEPFVHTHYSQNGADDAVIVAPGSSGTYEESCRMIRVDGMWRTASDMYNRYSGLLATAAAAGKTDLATTGVPTVAAANSYGGNLDLGMNGFVKDLLAAYRSNNWLVDLAAASELYQTAGLNAPESLDIRRPTATARDQRYLHLRGLYVDTLTPQALARIQKAQSPANCRSTNTFECILPFIPFTTINLTEIGFWKTQVKPAEVFNDSTSILKVETASTLTFNATEPFRGRTNALPSSVNDDIAYAVASITRSNSGVAVAPEGVDPEDDRVWSLDTDENRVASWTTDRQKFRVRASGTSSGTDTFWVAAAGLPQLLDKETLNDPRVDWMVAAQIGSCGGTFDSKRDLNPSAYVCNNTPTLGVAGQVTLADYYLLGNDSVAMNASCSFGTGSVAVSGTVPRPFYRNFEVASATIGAAAGSLAVGAEGTLDEATTITFTTIPASSTVTVSFQEQTKKVGTIASCTATRLKNGSYVFGSIVWNKSWEQRL